jgi:hypothetical protein
MATFNRNMQDHAQLFPAAPRDRSQGNNGERNLMRL